MGGELQLSSVAGSGSEFWFILTFERGLDVWTVSPEMANLDVLIADDNPIARETLRSIVDGLGWKPTVVHSGEAAIQQLQTKQVHTSKTILLLDYKMPGLNGLATAKKIRHELKDANDPIIIMVTAYSSNEMLAHPDSHLADVFISKPITPSSLYNGVARAMRVRQGIEEQVPSRPSQRLSGLRIQVVDDSEINREVAQRIFMSEGAQVVLANDGLQAFNWLQANPTAVDIVLMDIQMPIMDGYEAARQIRRIPALAELPVVALSAGAFIEQQELANAVGMSGFIAKPFDVDAAIALIIKLTKWDVKPTSETVTPAPIKMVIDQEYSGLMLEQGLKYWEEPSVYQQYLRKFAHDYADITQLIAQAEKTEALRLAHKLKGVAGSLALQEVATQTRELEAGIRAGAEYADNLMKLQIAMDTALTSIQKYAPVDIPAENKQSIPLCPIELTALLFRMLAALDTDSPVEVRPIMTELCKILPLNSQITLQTAIENYDFRGAESAIKGIADNYNISLER
jgi:hypothetical protein